MHRAVFFSDRVLDHHPASALHHQRQCNLLWKSLLQKFNSKSLVKACRLELKLILKHWVDSRPTDMSIQFPAAIWQQQHHQQKHKASWCASGSHASTAYTPCLLWWSLLSESRRENEREWTYPDSAAAAAVEAYFVRCWLEEIMFAVTTTRLLQQQQ